MNITETNNKKIGLVIMASGLGKRFGGNKLMEELQGKPLLQWVLDTSENLFDKRVVVTRSNEVKALCERLAVECILHDFPGRNDTVRLGVSTMAEEVDYCFFSPGDQPLLQKASLLRLIKAAKENPDRICRAGYGDRVGAPMGFPKAFFGELMELPEGKGGNIVAKAHPSLVLTVMVQGESELWDIDTRDDLELVKRVL